jgi:DNA end-binding protein Ku
MRSAWTGTIQCGPLNLPVKLGVTVPTARASMFHRTHTVCATRIKQKTWCPTCKIELTDTSKVGKGVELDDKSMVLFTDDELESLRVWDAQVLKLEHFCPVSQINPKLRDQTYFVEPDKGGGPAHRLLLDAMAGMEGVCAVGTIGYKDRTAPAVIEVVDGIFEVTVLRFPEELRSADVTLPPTQTPRPQEIKMMAQFIKTLTRDWDPAEHVDGRSQSVLEMVAAKSAGSMPAPLRPKDTAAQYTDMMSMLEQSIAEQKKTTTKPRARKAPTAKAS